VTQGSDVLLHAAGEGGESEIWSENKVMHSVPGKGGGTIAETHSESRKDAERRKGRNQGNFGDVSNCSQRESSERQSQSRKSSAAGVSKKRLSILATMRKRHENGQRLGIWANPGTSGKWRDS